MSKHGSFLIAVLFVTITIAADPPHETPAPTRTPNADRAADREHQNALRKWDRERQKYFRDLQRTGRIPAASSAPIAGYGTDPKVFDRLKHKKIREFDRKFQAQLRAWDRRRQKAYRGGVQMFPDVKPGKPDIEELAMASLTGTYSSPSSPEISPAARVLDW